MREVYIHGRALISGLGQTLTDAFLTLKQKRHVATQFDLPDGSQCPYVCIPNPDGLSWLLRIETLVKQALFDANLMHLNEVPLVIASSCIGIGVVEETEGLGDYGFCSSFSDHIRDVLGWRGEVYLVPVACTASMQAILLAQNIILSNQADDVLVLGVELANRVTASGFAAMQLLSHTTSKPLGKDRDGMVLGEAVAVMHLSTMSSRWKVMGGASLVSGKDVTGVTPLTVHDVCQRALLNSKLQPSDIDIIKLQASGSLNDINEINGLQQVFHTMPALVTWKHLVGHTLGASGLAEMILLMAGREQAIWPKYDYVLDDTSGVEKLDDAPTQTRHLLTMILGFGGEHAAIVLKDTWSDA